MLDKIRRAANEARRARTRNEEVPANKRAARGIDSEARANAALTGAILQATLPR